ncbi:hypothetical protein M758_7G159300 [Ceratodon purpureus]|nr:hypothetical protein M758_7G159300 [Ceratodon purpureus]
MAAMAHGAGMGVCWMAPTSSMRLGMAGGRASGGVAREVCFGNGRVRISKGLHAWACKAEEDENLPKGVNPVDLEQEFRKALESEESKALMQDLAEAAKRVSEKKRELDELSRREEKVEKLQSFLERLDANQEVANSAVSEIEEEVLKAEAEVRAAELALVMARAGNSATELSGKWETSDIDEDVERIESGKAAAVSAIAGTFASLPFTIAVDGGLTLGALLSQAGILLSCVLFGVTYRYAVRRDLGNLQLKSGVAAAFGLVRGAGYAAESLAGFPETGFDDILKASLVTGESVLIFVTAAVALDYCLRENLLSPFPSKKQP